MGTVKAGANARKKAKTEIYYIHNQSYVAYLT